jgi:RNA polymerase sigma-70 factor (ECF subfamily)
VSALSDDRLGAFEACRRDLVSLAYRMLGDMGRAEDMAQETWLRWSRTTDHPDSPRAYLVTILTRLCLNELDSARMRREESRADRLPEPVAIDDSSVERLEELDQVSMALLVVLQQLKPTERGGARAAAPSVPRRGERRRHPCTPRALGRGRRDGQRRWRGWRRH